MAGREKLQVQESKSNPYCLPRLQLLVALQNEIDWINCMSESSNTKDKFFIDYIPVFILADKNGKILCNSQIEDNEVKLFEIFNTFIK